MLVFYRVRKTLIISLITIVLDGLITYYYPSYFNHLNYFYPMLTVSLLSFVSLINKRYLYIIIGIIYDLLYSSIFLYNIIVFIIIVNIDIKLSKYFKNSLWLFILLSLLNILIYDLIGFIMVYLTNYQAITINDLIYKIDHSILLNILSVFVFWFLFKKELQHT